MLTENGIELDLKESNYTAEFGSYIFYFSSVNYRDKFLERLKPFILVETIKFKNKYGINLNIQEEIPNLDILVKNDVLEL